MGGHTIPCGLIQGHLLRSGSAGRLVAASSVAT